MFKKYIEKFIARRVPETFDPNLVRYVLNVWDEHSEELSDVWHRTDLQQRNNLAIAFRKELEREWQTEFKEMLLEQVFYATAEKLITNIEAAYAAGYMLGKGWISMEHLADFNLYLGDNLASHIRSILKGAKSRGLAFAGAFASVGVAGQLATSRDSQ